MCGRAVNGFVNGRRCPSCGETVSDSGESDGWSDTDPDP